MKECDKADMIEMIRLEISEIKNDQKEIKKDIKSLLQFKAQVVGGAIASSAIIGFIYNVIVNKLGGE